MGHPDEDALKVARALRSTGPSLRIAHVQRRPAARNRRHLRDHGHGQRNGGGARGGPQEHRQQDEAARGLSKRRSLPRAGRIGPSTA